MEDQLITFETAKLARDKGIDITTNGYYDGVGTYCSGVYNKYALHPHFSGCYTQSLLARWLREVHQLHVVAVSHVSGKWFICIYHLKEYGLIYDSDDVCYDTFELAIEAGLQEALKLVK